MKIWCYEMIEEGLYGEYEFYSLPEENENLFDDTFEINDELFKAYKDAKNVAYALERVIIDAAREQGVIR